MGKALTGSTAASADLKDTVDFDGEAKRQGWSAHSEPCMTPAIAKHGDKEIRRAVDHFGVVLEV